MGQLFILILSIFAMITSILIAFFIGFNGATTPAIIERLPILLSPLNVVYYMYIVLFAFFIVYLINAFKNRQTIYMFTWLQLTLFSSSSIFQMAFLYFWHFGYYALGLISFIVQLGILFLLYKRYPLNRTCISLRLPIAFYFSWQLFFLLVLINFFTVYVSWNGFGLSNALWAVIYLTFGTAIALHIRYHYFDRTTPIVMSIGYLGIVLANGFHQLFVTAATLFLIGVMIVGAVFIEKKKK